MMRMIACTALIVLNGCGSSDSTGAADMAASDPVPGRYACSDTYQQTFTTPAGYPATSGSLSWTSTVVENGDGTISTTYVSPQFSCGTEKSMLSGTTATLIGTFSCVFGNGITVVYTMANSTFTAGGVAGPFAYTFSGNVGGGDAGASVMVAGSGSGTYTCTRM